jgi:hypothetical protein
MHRLTELATSLLLATCVLAIALMPVSAFAGQTGSATPSAAASAVAMAAAPAASDKVYPPLPTLAMLPPNSDEEDDPQPKVSPRKKKSRAPERKSVAPAPHMIVSDASHVYLGNIEKQLDLALAK